MMPIVAGLTVSAVLLTSGSASAVTSTQVTGSGSDTTYYMMTSLGDLYNEAPGCNPLFSTQPLDGSCPNSGSENVLNFVNYYHDFSVERFPIGSSGGINQLCKHGQAGVINANFARSSRVPLNAGSGGSDCGGLRFVGYAKDGLTWECFPGTSGSPNPCRQLTTGSNNMTQATLVSIFVDCTITDWASVGGTAGTIDVYVPQGKSGTGVSWGAFLGVNLGANPLDTCIPPANKAPAVQPGQPGSHVSLENTNALIHTNGDEANAIFPWSVGVYHFTYGANAFTGSDGSSLGKINNVQATDANILSGSFPASRFLFNAYCKGTGSPLKCGTAGPAAASTLKFVGENGFICKNESKFKDTSSNPILDPVTGLQYRGAPSGSTPTGEIADMINASGFVPLPKQAPGGTTGKYCIIQNS